MNFSTNRDEPNIWRRPTSHYNKNSVLRFSWCFSVISCFIVDIYIRIHYHFSTFTECWLVGSLRWSVAPIPLRIPLAQPSSYATAQLVRPQTFERLISIFEEFKNKLMFWCLSSAQLFMSLAYLFIYLTTILLQAVACLVQSCRVTSSFQNTTQKKL